MSVLRGGGNGLERMDATSLKISGAKLWDFGINGSIDMNKIIDTCKVISLDLKQSLGVFERNLVIYRYSIEDYTACYREIL